MRKTLFLTLVALSVVIGIASAQASGPAATVSQSSDCPPGATNVDYCQVAPSQCSNGKGVTQIGTAGDDLQIGSRCADTQRGGGGNDIQRGFGGGDRQDGGSGNDTLEGGAGNDKQSGGAGNDLIRGGAGNDSISGGRGLDVLNGQAGNDTISARDGKKDSIRCGSGKDKVTADAIDKVSPDCEKVSRK